MIRSLKSRVEDTFETVLTWFTQNRLKVNPSKTKMLVIKSRRHTANTDFSVSFGEDEISPSDSVKILGVTLDPHLSWDSHVGIVVRRCNSILNSPDFVTSSRNALGSYLYKRSCSLIRYCLTGEIVQLH